MAETTQADKKTPSAAITINEVQAFLERQEKSLGPGRKDPDRYGKRFRITAIMV